MSEGATAPGHSEIAGRPATGASRNARKNKSKRGQEAVEKETVETNLPREVSQASLLPGNLSVAGGHSRPAFPANWFCPQVPEKKNTQEEVERQVQKSRVVPAAALRAATAGLANFRLAPDKADSRHALEQHICIGNCTGCK